MLNLLSKTPVTEFRVFQFGLNNTIKGDVIFDVSSSAAVIAQYEAEFQSHSPPKRLQINYNHSPWNPMVAANPESGIAAGWCDIVVRDDGLYAVNVTWTPRATQYLADEEYKYFSPEVTTDNDGIVYRIEGIAITNIPAMHVVQPLALSKLNGVIQMEVDEFIAKVKEMLGLVDEADFQKVFDALVEKMKTDVEEEVVNPVDLSKSEELSQLRQEVETLSRQLVERDIDDTLKIAVSQGVSPAQANVMKQLALNSRDTRNSLTLLSGMIKDSPKVKLNAKVIQPVEESGEVTVAQYRKMTEKEKKQLFVDNQELALKLSKLARQ